MIRSELLRIRYSLAAKLLLIVLLAETMFISLLFTALPAMIDGLIALNDVIPNATSADQFSDAQLQALSLAAPTAQLTIIDVLGNSGTGISLPVIAALLFGALTITFEYRRASLTTAVLAEPRRGRLLLHKLTALTMTALAAAAALTLLRFMLLLVGAAVQGETLLLDPAQIVGFGLRGMLTLTLYTWIGFAIGLLVRSPVAVVLTLGAAIAVESIVRPIVTLLLGAPNPTQYLPLCLVPDISGTNPLAAINDAPTFMDGIGTLPALLTLAAWAVVTVSIAAIRFRRADVPSVA
ncbi:hypothetical protein [Arthrobacter rhombi]|uniref:hypothetical protein n=1 Tax=Arthrobacter rhombi TaxID=71253 RepID=UPI003FD3D0C1